MEWLSKLDWGGLLGGLGALGTVWLGVVTFRQGSKLKEQEEESKTKMQEGQQLIDQFKTIIDGHTQLIEANTRFRKELEEEVKDAKGMAKAAEKLAYESTLREHKCLEQYAAMHGRVLDLEQKLKEPRKRGEN